MKATSIDRSVEIGCVKVQVGGGGGLKRKIGGISSGGDSFMEAAGGEDAEDDESRVSAEAGKGADRQGTRWGKKRHPPVKPMSTLDRIMEENRAKRDREEEEARRKKEQDLEREEKERKRTKREKKAKKKDYWLRKGIIIKVVNKKLEGGKYYKQKGVVETVVEKYAAKVRLLDSASGIVLLLDQDDLETVIPNAGKTVVILNGYGRGEEAVMVEILDKEFKGRLKMDDGTIIDVDYENFSRKHER